jgi:hypothetical protein
MNPNLIDAVAEWERKQDLEKSRTVMLALEVANEIPAYILVDTMWPQPLGSELIRVFINLAQLLVKDEGGQYVWKDGKPTHDEAAELVNSKAATAWFTARYPEAVKGGQRQLLLHGTKVDGGYQWQVRDHRVPGVRARRQMRHQRGEENCHPIPL